MIYDDVFFMESEEIDYFIMNSSLKTDIISYDISNMVNAYKIQSFLESGDEKKSSIIGAVLNKIKKILETIGSIVSGFFQGISQIGGDHLTPEDYMNSEAAQIRLDEDIVSKKMAIDEEYLKLRKIISKISDISHIPPEAVAMVSDMGNELVHKNRFKIADAGKSMIKAEVASRLANNVASKMKSVQRDKEIVDKCIDKLKERNEPIDPKDLTKLQKISQSLHNTAISYLGCYNKLTEKLRKKDIARDYYDKSQKRRARDDKMAERKESVTNMIHNAKEAAFNTKEKAIGGVKKVSDSTKNILKKKK